MWRGAEAKKVTSSHQNRDMLGRDFDNLIVRIEHRGESVWQVPIVAVPEQFRHRPIARASVSITSIFAWTSDRMRGERKSAGQAGRWGVVCPVLRRRRRKGALVHFFSHSLISCAFAASLAKTL